EGRPFVGPAGAILDRALDGARIERSTVYVTNAVKHFKFRERGKRRIHQRPDAAEVAACRRWLAAEVELVAPAVVVAMGATAARAGASLVWLLGGGPGRALRGRVAGHEGRSLGPTLASSVKRAPGAIWSGAPIDGVPPARLLLAAVAAAALYLVASRSRARAR